MMMPPTSPVLNYSTTLAINAQWSRIGLIGTLVDTGLVDAARWDGTMIAVFDGVKLKDVHRAMLPGR